MKLALAFILSALLLLSASGLLANNNALTFNPAPPVDDYVLLGTNVYNQILNGSAGITFEGFFKLSHTPSAPYSRLISIPQTPSLEGFSLCVSSNGQLICRARSSEFDLNTSYAMTNAGIIGTNQWYRVAATVNFAQGSIKLYLNATDVTLVQYTYFSQTAYQAGAGGVETFGNYNGIQFFRGQVDGFRLWSQVRSAAEIAANLYSELHLPQPGLIGYWMFNETAGTSAADSSISNNPGSLVNFAADPWTGVNLDVTPLVSILEYDETVTLSVNISEVRWFDPLRGFELQVDYDPSFLTCAPADFTEGLYLSSFASVYGLGTRFYVRGVDGAWIVSGSILSVPPGTQVQPFGASGDGELFSLTLTARHQASCPSSTPVTLSDITLRNEVNHPILPDTVAGAEIFIKPTLVIPLHTGWNLISSWVVPQNMAIDAVFADLRDDGYLIKVQDELGRAYLNELGGWANNIGNYQMTEGYYVQVNSDCDLIIKGTCIILPLTVELRAGWNIIPYPYHDPQSAMAFIQPLIDSGLLIKVQDELGRSIVQGISGGWEDYIGTFMEGEGYYVQVSAATSITFSPLGRETNKSVDNFLNLENSGDIGR